MSLQKIKVASALGYSEVCIVDELLKGHWCEDADLVYALDHLTKAEDSLSAVAFLQLPYRIRLPEQWIPIASGEGDPMIRFRLTGSLHNQIEKGREFSVVPRHGFGDVESFVNASLPNDEFGLLCNTQVMIQFKLWGRRRLWYDKYLALLSEKDAYQKTQLVPARASWLPHSRPLTASTYEVDLATRIYKQVLTILNPFISQYAIACRDPMASIIKSLSSFFIMVRTGRLIVRGARESSLALAAQPVAFEKYSRNLTLLQDRFAANTSITIYESYLLEAVRQAESGNGTLAVVQTFMILDWFANSILEDRLLSSIRVRFADNTRLADVITEGIWEERSRLKPSTYDKYKKFFPLVGLMLKPALLDQLNSMKNLRNEIVHRKQADRVASSTAKTHIEAAFSIISESMRQLLKRTSENK